MRYEKPILMDISGQGRAAGMAPMGCYDGLAPSGSLGLCQAGGFPTTLNNQCANGPQPGLDLPAFCISGSSPGVMFCMTGAGGFALGENCTSGPQPA